MSRIAEWLTMSTKLKALRVEEADIRRGLAYEVIGDAQMTKGRVTVKDTLDGFAVKAVNSLNYKIDQAALGMIWENLTDEDKESIRMVPDLKLRNYKNLPDDSLLHDAIITSLAMPTLEAKPINNGD